MPVSTAACVKEEYFLKSPRELFMLFSGGEVTTSKPIPDPVPDPVVETVDMAVKSSSVRETVLTNHPSLLGRPLDIISPFGEHHLFHKDLAKDSHLMCLKVSLVIKRENVGGIDIGNPVSDVQELAQELLNNHVTLQLVSTEADPATGSGKLSGKVTFEHWTRARDLLIPTFFQFKMNIYVTKDFGVPGAMFVNNGHKDFVLQLSKATIITTEFFLKEAHVTMPDNSVISFLCKSWVYPIDKSQSNVPGRIFFANKVCTPATTPAGLVHLRKSELQDLQGDGTGERKVSDRIYDYDVYNDLATPEDPRPILGGSAEYPYPRRCRTGRKLNPDGKTETRLTGALADDYVPRDERFDEVKKSGFLGDSLKAKKHDVVANLYDHDKDFQTLDEIRDLYVPIGKDSEVETLVDNQQKPFELLRQFVHASGDDKNVWKYPTPRAIAADKDAWAEDIEFARQLLAGINPLVIELLKEFPLKRTSAVTAELIEPQLEGLGISEALQKKRLFVVDYHERFLGYIQRINLQTSKAYASLTLLFLTNDGILRPILIELTLPGVVYGDSSKSRVFRPAEKGATVNWAWELAKSHVMSNDAAWHQVISHWLQTHASIEPFIIATNRQLSIMHPVHRALVSHYKNTLDINQSARKALINAGGIVEQIFTPQKFSMEISSVVYRGWRFVEQALPNDLVKRGMAVPDPTARHGLKLVIEDYPYAKDGLELWSAIRTWVKEHVDIFYTDDGAVQADDELQTWWTEARTKGHPDITEGWILADTKESLVQIITTIAWVASCHHAAVNFGQYLYAGFMPNHPSMTRKLIPEEDTPEWESLQIDPIKFLLSMLSNAVQTRLNMTTIEILSTHASNEEYLGQRPEHWTDDPKVLAAFDRFSKKIDEIDALIKERNADPSLKNRQGPIKVNYELLRPASGSGLTNRGVPNSISI